VLVLTGDPGTGKSIVARTLAELMRAQGMAIARLDRPAQTPDDFLQAVAEGFGWPEVRSGNVRAAAERYLADGLARGTRALLIVEDAHRLGREVPAQVAHLVKSARQHGADQAPPLTVLLVGHEKFLDTLDSEENAVLESVIDGRYRLQPLTEDEVHRYIERFAAAESASRVFTKPAMNKIAEISRGIPRDIDALCEAALSSASRPRAWLGTPAIPASTAATPATRQATDSPRSAVKVNARLQVPRLRKPSRKIVLVAAGMVVLIALPAAYTLLRQITPQWAAARMTPSIPPPPPTAEVAVPVETPPVELPPPTEATVQESAAVPDAAPTPAPVQERSVPVPETALTPPAPSPVPRPTAVAAPSVAAPALRERPTPRPEPPAPAASRPAPPRERPPAAPRPARSAAAESDGSAAIDWLFRNTPRASD
jgi:type II secretory pathway predicted ATPase ExeA